VGRQVYAHTSKTQFGALGRAAGPTAVDPARSKPQACPRGCENELSVAVRWGGPPLRLGGSPPRELSPRVALAVALAAVRVYSCDQGAAGLSGLYLCKGMISTYCGCCSDVSMCYGGVYATSGTGCCDCTDSQGGSDMGLGTLRYAVGLSSDSAVTRGSAWTGLARGRGFM